jgi:hypothetical protein
MTRTLRTASFLAAALATVALTGCDYFGTHEGYEDGELPLFGLQGTAAFELVGVAPSTASEGDEVDLYLLSESEAQVTGFTIDSFWFCTSDGMDPMIETGGDSYEATVDADDFFANVDTDLTEEEIADNTISTVTFTVPPGTQSGEGFVITPGNQNEYFDLTIQ